MIAGEASGDLHGSNLIKAIKAKDDNAVIQCWGGDLMESAGGTLVKHYRSLAFMGLVEVLMNLRTILSNIKFCKKDIEAFQPALRYVNSHMLNMKKNTLSEKILMEKSISG